jgi:hypothetical protein
LIFGGLGVGVLMSDEDRLTRESVDWEGVGRKWIGISGE